MLYRTISVTQMEKCLVSRDFIIAVFCCVDDLQLQKLVAKNLGGFPMPLCHYQRAKGCRLFIGEANFGYCASKDEKYYGF